MGRRNDERGFTLIELMVVVLVIAILMAAAIPTFFGARERANDRAVQSNVRNAFTAVRIFYNGSQEYTADPAEMRRVEPTLDWTDLPLDSSAPQRRIAISVYDVPWARQTVILAGRSAHGRCFFVKDVMGGSAAGTFYSRDVSGAATCSPPAPDAPVWAAEWQV